MKAGYAAYAACFSLFSAVHDASKQKPNTSGQQKNKTKKLRAGHLDRKGHDVALSTFVIFARNVLPPPPSVQNRLYPFHDSSFLAFCVYLSIVRFITMYRMERERERKKRKCWTVYGTEGGGCFFRSLPLGANHAPFDSLEGSLS